MDTSSTDVTRLLNRTVGQDPGAPEELLGLVYEQLRRIAQQRMNDERREHTLQATALVHEAYLRLVGDQDVAWVNRAHFFAAAAEAMRRILIEHARARGRVKRGGDAEGKPARRLSLNVVTLATEAAGQRRGAGVVLADRSGEREGAAGGSTAADVPLFVSALLAG